MDSSVRDVINYLDGAEELIRKVEKAQEEKKSLQQAVIRLEKQRETTEKACTDETAGLIKKRRDALESEFGKQLGEANQILKKLQDKKEAARTAGKKERTERETAGLRRVTAQLEKEQKAAQEAGDLPGICGVRLLYHLFLPQNLLDGGLVLLFAAVLLYAEPLFIYLTMKETQPAWMLTVLHAVFGFVFIGLYVLIRQKIYLPRKDLLEDIRLRDNEIRKNKKEIREITASIAADPGEEYYHLEDFNYDIAKAEAARDELRRRRDEALNSFDLVTRKVIADEVYAQYEEELTRNDLEIETRHADLKRAETQVRNLSGKAVEAYAGLLGKENLRSSAIVSIRKIVEERRLTNVTEAVNLYNGKV